MVGITGYGAPDLQLRGRKAGDDRRSSTQAQQTCLAGASPLNCWTFVRGEDARGRAGARRFEQAAWTRGAESATEESSLDHRDEFACAAGGDRSRRFRDR